MTFPLCRCPTGVCYFHPSLSTCGMRDGPAASAPAVDDPRWTRLYNLITNLAHPYADHREHPLEDEAHDVIRELRHGPPASVPVEGSPQTLTVWLVRRGDRWPMEIDTVWPDEESAQRRAAARRAATHDESWRAMKYWQELPPKMKSAASTPDIDKTPIDDLAASTARANFLKRLDEIRDLERRAANAPDPETVQAAAVAVRAIVTAIKTWEGTDEPLMIMDVIEWREALEAALARLTPESTKS